MLTVGPLSSRFPKLLFRILLAGFFAHVLGALARYLILKYGYHWMGDATGYFRQGVNFASMIWHFDFSFMHPEHGDTRMWGTNLVRYFSGFVLAIIGPTMPGEFLLLSFLSMIGLALFLKTFQVNYFGQGLKQFALWLLLWPSLCYWPSSIGKESILLFSIGIFVYGFAGKQKKIQLMIMFFGIGIAAVIRPHVAGILVVSVIFAHWFEAGTRWNLARSFQGLVIVVLGILFLQSSLDKLQIEASLESIEERVQERSTLTAPGVVMQGPPLSLKGLPIALTNVLFRPGPWEAFSPSYFVGFVEMYAFWVLVVIRRRRIFALLKEWRHHRLLRLAIPFSICYIIILGFAVGNLGIISRQRVLVLPFLLLWLEAIPAAELVVQEPVATNHRQRALGPVVLKTRRKQIASINS